jgi:hypothetical protein
MDINPYAPPRREGEPVRDGRRSVKTAVRCLVCSIGLIGVTIVSSWLNLLPATGASNGTGSNVVTFFVLSLLTLKIAGGRNWARWVFAVGSGFGTLVFVYFLLSAPQQVWAMPALLLGVMVLQFALQGVAIALLFTRGASQWFKTAADSVTNRTVGAG